MLSSSAQRRADVSSGAAPELAPELIDLIIDFLHDNKGALCNCALVCRAWVPRSRYHSFSVISLHPGHRCERFIEMLDSPFSTSQWWQTHTLNIAQNVYSGIYGEPWNLSNLFQRLMCWLSSDGNKTIPSTFPSLTKLVIDWVDWRTLISDATSSISFLTLTYLRLWNVPFIQSHDFLSFVQSFTVLETLDLEDVRVGKVIGNQLVRSAKLRSLLLNGESAQMLEMLAQQVTYESGLQHLKLQYVNFSDLKQDVLSAISGLLKCAGPSLEKLEFDIQAAGKFDTVAEMGNGHTYERSMLETNQFIRYSCAVECTKLLVEYSTSAYHRGHHRRAYICPLTSKARRTWNRTCRAPDISNHFPLGSESSLSGMERLR